MNNRKEQLIRAIGAACVTFAFGFLATVVDKPPTMFEVSILYFVLLGGLK